MSRLSDWPKVESQVHLPGRWLSIALGSLVALLVFVAPAFAPFSLLGACFAVAGIYRLLLPAVVQHAAGGVLPDVPCEPVIRDGVAPRGNVNQLIEEPTGWRLRPAQWPWRNHFLLAIAIGVPFFALHTATLAWVAHQQPGGPDWPQAIRQHVPGTLCWSGIAMICIGVMTITLLRPPWRRFGHLVIPHGGGDLELEMPAAATPEADDSIAGLHWEYCMRRNWRRVTIPRRLVVAVQLCPCKNVKVATSAVETSLQTWSVQGVLVLQADPPADYRRLPLLLSNNLVTAARLMQRLADILDVPYLFAANRAGWQAESQREKTRPPHHAGDRSS